MDKFTLTNIELKKHFSGAVVINHSPVSYTHLRAHETS